MLVEDPVADGERGADRALRVVLVRNRGAEHGHHGVADELLDRPPEALELVAQPRVIRPEQRAHLLGIHALRARGEADEVGEEDGHDLALLEPRVLVDCKRRRAGVAETRAIRILLAAAGARKHHREAYGARSQGSRGRRARRRVRGTPRISSSTERRCRRDPTARVARKKFTEPVALSSTLPADLPLSRRTVGLSFDLLALRARCVEEPMGARRLGQGRRSWDSRSLRDSRCGGSDRRGSNDRRGDAARAGCMRTPARCPRRPRLRLRRGD